MLGSGPVAGRRLPLPMAQRTPLHDRHVALGARMVEFGGWDMPLQYSNIRDEHTAVRTRAGLFDVSHMGRVTVGGEGAEAALQRLMTNNVGRLAPLQSLYTVMCREDGGVIDDLIVNAAETPGQYIVVVNASTTAKDVAWIRTHLDAGVEFVDISAETSLIALQGPRAAAILQPLSDADLSTLRPFHLAPHAVSGIPARMSFVSRTGYTGEDGFELIVDAAQAGALWDLLLQAGEPEGLRPCGLGARDTLRLEAGLRLYGQDMDESVDPLSAGLGWTVKLDKGDFIGAPALRRIKEQGVPRRFVGLRMDGRAIARHGMPVLRDGERVGDVTSGTFSFTLGCGIATAYVTPEVAASGERLQVDIRGTSTRAEQVPLPFYKRPPA
jgi:aminomethyltransferase